MGTQYCCSSSASTRNRIVNNSEESPQIRAGIIIAHTPSEYLNDSFPIRRVQESLLLGGRDGGRFGG
jgi:hypothetical protein